MPIKGNGQVQTPEDDKLCRLVVESRKRHEWFVGTYTSSLKRNGEFLFANDESSKASWSGLVIKQTNNKCEVTGSELCK